MGSPSYFIEESEIYIKDKEFLEFCKKHKDDKLIGEELEPIIEWYKENKNFSFSIFDGWKIQSYWYDSFLALLKIIELFIDSDKVENGDYGEANFMFENNLPFKFELDYEEKKIRVLHVGDTWSEFYPGSELRMSLPKNLSKEIKQLEVINAL